MAVRPEFRILLESESARPNGYYLKLDERGGDDGRSIYMTIAGAGMTPYEDDPVLELSLEEATELREVLNELIGG